MTKITLNAVNSFQNDTTATTLVNNNSDTIVTAFDNTISRDGTAPNQMEAPFDMNSNQILNLPAPISTQSPVRLEDVTNLIAGGSIIVNPIPNGLTFNGLSVQNLSTYTNIVVYGRVIAGDMSPMTMIKSGTSPAGVPASLIKQSLDGAFWYPESNQDLYPEHAGSITGSTTPAATTQAIKDIITFNHVCYLRDQVTYQISSGIIMQQLTGSSYGLVCKNGQAILQMMTGTGQFDNATIFNPGSFPTNAIGVYFYQIDKPTLKNVKITMQSNVALRTCIPLAIRYCTNLKIDTVEMNGFQDCASAMFIMDSVQNGYVKDVYCHDSQASDITLANCTLGGISIDSNRVAGSFANVDSIIKIIRPFVQNITQTQASITHFNYQTDGILATGAQGGTGTGCIELIEGRIENVAQGYDIEATRVQVNGVMMRNIQVWPFKFVHDAVDVQVRGYIDVQNSGSSAIVFAGTSSGTVGCNNIDVWGGTYSGIGSITTTGPTSFSKAVFSNDGTTATFQPHNIRVINPRVNIDSNATYLVDFSSGGITNTYLTGVEMLGSPATAIVSIAGGTLSATNAVTLRSKSLVRASQTGNVTPGSVTANIVCGTKIQDTNNEFATGTGIFTAKRPMQAIVTAGLRSSALALSKSLLVGINAGGLTRAVQEYQNTSTAGGAEVQLNCTAIVTLAPGDTVIPFLTTNDNAAVITGDGTEHYTRIQIQEI